MPVVVIALLVGGLIFWRRRRVSPDADAKHEREPLDRQRSELGGNPLGEMESKSETHELAARERVELEGSEVPMLENEGQR